MNARTNGPGYLPEPQRGPVHDPVDRVLKMLFGLFMALTFVGAVSVVNSRDDEVRSPRHAMLCGGGFALGRHAGYGGPRAGFVMAGLGTALVAVIIALGG
jgi:hypothetical protein